MTADPRHRTRNLLALQETEEEDLPCFDSRSDLKLWHMLNRSAGENKIRYTRTGTVRKHADTPCTDCTPEYKARMVKEGRCAYPQVRFVPVIEKGAVVGLEGRRDDA